jgi:penicillin-binding protein 1C
MKRSLLRRRWSLPVAGLLLFLLWFRFGPMDPLFTSPYSTVVVDRRGELLGAAVAADGQWRMRADGPVPERFERCLLEFEDRHFWSHPGVHLPSLVRAWQQNRRTGRTVSGGSTLTMQLMRLSSGAGERSYLRKLREIFSALRLEMRMDKDEILALYCAHAPFGGNVVGLEAASWRWFGRSTATLGWAECAMLAVLPNSPARMHPGRGRDALRAKRDRLLDRLLQIGAIDSMEHSLAREEELPDAPLELPRRAPQLLTTLRQGPLAGTTIRTTLDGQLQDRVTFLADRYGAALRANEVHNAALLVLDVPTGEVLAYMGNLPSAGPQHAPDVDIVHARRSTGSLLKPFLYAAMLQDGELLPDQLVADLPTHYEGFAPRNFDQRHAGAVPASNALARSLNIPAVRALRTHGIDRTLRTLRGMGLRQLDRSADHYGLSLIVGGGESSLWELTGAYASLARAVLTYHGEGHKEAVVHPPVLLPDQPVNARPTPLHAAACWHTLQALQQLNRPEAEEGWRHFGGETIAWKTGTSYGHRDAWAIGVTDRYAVGVWTGNASGEGRPGLTGTLAAAPLLFELFDVLPDGRGFDPPYDALVRLPICRASGHLAAAECPVVDSTWTIRAGMRTGTCPYHRWILVDAQGRYRSQPGRTGARQVAWFVLPPAMETYYRTDHPGYLPLPPWPDGEQAWEGSAPMQMIYPEQGSHLHIPVQLDGSFGQVVFEAAHREPGATLFWDLDGQHRGRTLRDHRLPLDIAEGRHRLTLTDHRGYTASISFQVTRGKAPIQ